MADFCNHCAAELFGPGTPADIDVFKIFEALKPDYYQSGFICEGCALAAIMKTADGKLKVGYYYFGNEPHKEIEWIDYESKPEITHGI
ncbi:MAG: hypothetical protein M0R50_11745 [Candidatus Cloacimonetes bacterium]|jgi:hypothetical protein|nr:hypothetical protein [Candidatus Cloacimonadota bacterium]